MKIVNPILINDAVLISSSVAEPAPDEKIWRADENYAIHDVRIRPAIHRVFRCLIAGVNAGLPENTPDRWQDIGLTNKWRMFNLHRSVITKTEGDLVLVMQPKKRINSIVLLGMRANTVNVKITLNNNIVIYEATTALSKRRTTGYYQYYYGGFPLQSNLVLLDLPPNIGATITITLHSNSGSTECAVCAMGMSEYVGDTEFGAKSTAINPSKIERDDYGEITNLKKIRSYPRTSQRLILKKSMVDRAFDLREELNAVPAIYIGVHNPKDGYFKPMIISGFWKIFDIDITNVKESTIQLEVEDI